MSVVWAVLLALPPEGVAAWEAGLAARDDATRARQWFARAAASFEQTPGAALAAGHAWMLAGDLPRAVGAYRCGLAVRPDDARLQHALTYARGQVNPLAVPTGPGWLARQCGATRQHLGWWLVWLAWVGAIACLVRQRMTGLAIWRAGAVVSGGGALALAVVLGLAAAQAAAYRAEPFAVVAQAGVSLRTGNAHAYSPVFDAPLPRGQECRPVLRRGRWWRVELPGGAVGWLPAEAVLLYNSMDADGAN